MNGPKGIISAIGISIIVGWGYLLGITFAVTDIPYLLSEDNDAGGYAIAEVFYLVFKSRYGSGTGGIICLGIIAVAIFFCGMSSVTSNSRQITELYLLKLLFTLLKMSSICSYRCVLCINIQDNLCIFKRWSNAIFISVEQSKQERSAHECSLALCFHFFLHGLDGKFKFLPHFIIFSSDFSMKHLGLYSRIQTNIHFIEMHHLHGFNSNTHLCNISKFIH